MNVLKITFPFLHKVLFSLESIVFTFSICLVSFSVLLFLIQPQVLRQFSKSAPESSRCIRCTFSFTVWKYLSLEPSDLLQFGLVVITDVILVSFAIILGSSSIPFWISLSLISISLYI